MALESLGLEPHAVTAEPQKALELLERAIAVEGAGHLSLVRLVWRTTEQAGRTGIHGLWRRYLVT